MPPHELLSVDTYQILFHVSAAVLNLFAYYVLLRVFTLLTPMGRGQCKA